MTTDAPRFNPDPDDSFTPTSDADLAADPTTGRGPDGAPIDDTENAEASDDDTEDLADDPDAAEPPA